ncbi:conserved hypothetical protein [Histoplasma capsulatum var. duboisii H88]|uniref:Ell binding protein Ebp1 C-terminal domain-containing protein n=2 Tax=Ajellomyces capsulatus TaxID=5037 RepID=F0UML7_AJEC8|nr:conserved hypothetical protein [Histoplasma capsulatum H143]EGC48157.1 conserved hypothetical protein [Histoplasma capsulatum var. duboisii H88]QSS54310.1 hypothetical protein I7I53_01814 [Histoplasma capsulatum var. duboisii H88]
MSVELQTQNTTESSSRVPAKRSYSDYLKGVNTRFKHLSDKVLPASPYLLRVPTERPFHLGSRFVSNWAVGDNRPFAPEEEHLQYMTFLPHQDEDTLLVAVGGWSDERGNIMEEDTSKAPSITTSPSVDTPQHRFQRKKISLSDYKKKANETPKFPHRSTIPADRVTSGKPNSSRELMSTTTLQPIIPSKRKDTTSGITDNRPDNNTNGISKPKNSRDESSRSIPGSYKPPPSSRESPPLAKKPRLATTKESSGNASTRSKNAPPIVPALLSPTLPPTSVLPRLPRLLSPTLPPDVEEELAKLKSDELSINEYSNSRKPPSSSGPTGSKPELQLPQSNKARPHSNSTSSSSDKSTRARISVSSTSKPQCSSVGKSIPGNNPSNRAVDPKQSHISSKPKSTTEPAKPRLIVKLRYGRANRKRIEALLKFSGKYKFTPDNRSSKQKTESGQRKDHSAPFSKLAEMQRVEKRPRHREESEVQGSFVKRQKPSTIPSAEQPRTPVTTMFHSPAVLQQSAVASKGQFLTPGKDLKATAMRRLGSGDSDTRMPTGLDRAIDTNISGNTDKATKHSPLIPNDNQLSRPRDTAESRPWFEESQKYFNLGRELKHSSRRYAGPQATDSEEKLGAAIAVEAVLCFILAFILDDRYKSLNRRLGDSSGWLSIVPYWNMVKSNIDKYPHLHALCSLLGAIFHEVIHGLDLERLAITAIPSENSPGPTPNNDGNTVTLEESKKQQQHRDFLELRKRLVDSHRDARSLWLEGSRKLSEEVLTREYPETWSKRSMSFSERGRERSLELGGYSGEYFLPLDRTATPLEAIRFGWMFLTEWTEKEGVRWEGRLGL